MAAAAAGGVAALLPWLRGGIDNPNGFDIPVNFLVDYETVADHDFTVGILIVVFAAAALVGSLVRQGPWPKMVRPAGIGLATVGALFLLQLFRLTNEFDISYTEVVGVAPLLALAAGVVIVAVSAKAAKTP
jgi:hypothetical protein